MKYPSAILASLLVLATLPAVGAPGHADPGHAAHGHEAAGHGSVAGKLQSDTVVAQAAGDQAGKRWATDAALREGMARISRSVTALGHYEQGHMGSEQALVFAGDIKRDVDFLIANCKLEPAADAALHAIIAKLLKGAGALEADPADKAAIAPLREAIAEYARSFDDPAFAD